MKSVLCRITGTYGSHFTVRKGPRLPEILVDADCCPVREEIYRVAERYGLKVTLVSNSSIRIPEADWLKLVVVNKQFDAVDDWIVEHVGENDVVITEDIPLASRCLKKAARVVAPKGRVFSEDSIGQALADRELTSYLRDLGNITGGPPPFKKRDRSRFLHSLNEIIQAIQREKN